MAGAALLVPPGRQRGCQCPARGEAREQRRRQEKALPRLIWERLSERGSKWAVLANRLPFHVRRSVVAEAGLWALGCKKGWGELLERYQRPGALALPEGEAGAVEGLAESWKGQGDASSSGAGSCSLLPLKHPGLLWCPRVEAAGLRTWARFFCLVVWLGVCGGPGGFQGFSLSLGKKGDFNLILNDRSLGKASALAGDRCGATWFKGQVS